MWPGGKSDVAIYIYKDEATSPTREKIDGVDVGSPLLSGSAAKIDGKSYISAAGRDIWSYDDEFYFIPQSGTTDLKLKVHILSLEGKHEWTKVGLMMRETLDANSKHADCFQTLNRGVVFQYRESTWSSGRQFNNPERGGVWLQLEKQGNTYTCSWSTDGENWSEGHSRIVEMGDDFQYGMAMTSHDEYRLADAFYEDFTVEGLE